MHRVESVRARRWNTWLLAGALVFTGCATDVVATATHSDQLSGAPAPTDPPATDPPVTDPATDEPATSDPVSTDSPTPPPEQEPEQTAIDFGASKPSREYDRFLLATTTDLAAWWAEQYPEVYGERFVPLEGSIYAAYPRRRDALPGCGAQRTTYEEVHEFVAFYCGDGDFIIYDDGPNSLLTQLAAEFGPATIGIVLAHEYGHAIQQRNGVLNKRLATIVTEQQADCFSGAWAGRTFRGESPWVRFSDDDVRAGLIAMLEVRDPVGFDQTDPGGHGSGFDRVNAFQVGFNEGPSRCAQLVADPLPLVPNEYRTFEDAQAGGNAALTFDEENGLLNFLPRDLNLYWDIELDAEIPGFDGLVLEANESLDELECADLTGDFANGAALCASTGTVHLNMPVARELHSQSLTFGDYSVGYLMGYTWAEAVQQAAGSDREGEDRQLMNDCLTGAWSKSVIPNETGQLPDPRAEGRTSAISPGDLDEAIRTQVRLGDASVDEDVLGSPFEKIDAFRTGVLGGLAACDL